MLELRETLTPEDVAAARKATRVPPVVDDPSLGEQFASLRRRRREKRQQKTAHYDTIDRVAEIFPIAGWLRSYKWKQWLLNDVLAGLCVGLMVIPQGMSYAQNLAFLPQVYGIYGAFVPCLVYALLGSSKHLAVGPVAVTSLLLGSGLSGVFGDFTINPSHPNDAYEAAVQQNYNHGAIQISFLAGCFYTGIALLRLGWIVNYLSAPVISGFMTGAASIILSTQVKYLCGMYYLPRSDTVIQSLKYLYDNMALFRWPEFGFAVMFVLILLLCQEGGRRYTKLKYLRCLGPIIVTVLSLVIENAAKFYEIDFNNPATPILKDVGPVPAGMPEVTAGWWFPLYDTSKQLILAAVICVLDIAESTTVARRVAQEKQYKLNFTQELRALGFANVIGSVFNCYTTTGAFSRTTINELAGAQSLLSSVVTGIFVMIILLVATPLFTHLSVNVQGAIVCVAVLPLFDFKSGWYYYEVNKLDFLCWVVGYAVTALAGALPGIASAFGLSIAIVVLKAGFARITTFGKLRGTDLYRDPEQYDDVDMTQVEGVVVVRVEAPLFFGNLPVVKEHIEDEVAIRRARGAQVCAVVLDMEMSPQIDGAFCQTFKYYVQELRTEGITLIFANPSKDVVLTLQRSSLIVLVRPENLQLSMDDALARARVVMAMGTAESPVSEEPLSTAEKLA